MGVRTQSHRGLTDGTMPEPAGLVRLEVRIGLWKLVVALNFTQEVNQLTLGVTS